MDLARNPNRHCVRPIACFGNMDLGYIYAHPNLTQNSFVLQTSNITSREMTFFQLFGVGYDRKLLHMEEQRHNAALCVAKRKLNALLPISSLPLEIMEQIFNICVSWLYGHQKPKHRLAWTQVCCSWRIISLDSSKLWQRIDLADARLTEEFLSRSKQAPLSIVSTSPVKLAAYNLAPHSRRLQSIDVFLYPECITHLFSTIGRGLTTLTYLSLKVPPSFTSPPSTPLHLDISFPHVRHLSLDGVAVRWGDVRDLVHLEIRGLVPESCPSVSQLHGVFARSPNLEWIRVVNLVTSRLETNSKSFIPLYEVKDMIISSEPAVASAILSIIKLGPSSRLRLHTSLSKNSLLDLFPGGLPHVAQAHAVINIPTTRLSSNGIHLSQHGTPAWSVGHSGTVLSVTSSQMNTNICDSMRYLVDLSSVTKLELNTGALLNIPREDLNKVFANLHSLETLCTAFNELEDLCRVLQMSSPSTSKIYVPNLINLSFSKPAHRWWNFADRWLTEIIMCAKYRKLHSCPIQSIEFFRCHGISGTSTTELNDIIPRVIISDQPLSKSSF